MWGILNDRMVLTAQSRVIWLNCGWFLLNFVRFCCSSVLNLKRFMMRKWNYWVLAWRKMNDDSKPIWQRAKISFFGFYVFKNLINLDRWNLDFFLLNLEFMYYVTCHLLTFYGNFILLSSFTFYLVCEQNSWNNKQPDVQLIWHLVIINFIQDITWCSFQHVVNKN